MTDADTIRGELDDLDDRAEAEYYALSYISYTGDRPDLRAEDVESIRKLIFDLALERRTALRENVRLLERDRQKTEALRPFASFAELAVSVDEDGHPHWTAVPGEQLQRIPVWFGPSDFHAARAVSEGETA